MNGPIAPDAAAQEGWMEAQKAALKTGRLDQVLGGARRPRRSSRD